MGKLVLDRVGSDIEVFLMDEAKKPVPCVGLIKGTKEQPEPLGIGDGYAIQEDNVLLEYNIPASRDVYNFVYSIMRAQEAIGQRFAERKLFPVIAPSMKFEEDQLKSRQAKTAGCEPDYCVWTREINEPVALDKEIRGAGGHVHVSFLVDDALPTMPKYLTEIERLIMCMDITVGTPLSLLDKDKVRRQFYGKAGAFRAKTYGAKAAGLEYRVLSNYWTQSPKLMGYVFAQTERAIQLANCCTTTQLMMFKDKVCSAINDGNEVMARSIMRDWNVTLPA